MPKINIILLKLKGFHYDKLLDLIMGYYHIQLSEDTSKLCKSIPPWVNTITNVYQWELETHQKFYNRNLTIYSKELSLSVRT